ncbi:amino acid adenylation domain-containing protein [Micromonospora sp. CPCC 205546]|uniref:amino acid adenylation domain-containing protein n=1 Tax=Micromonospora sp. CPCC 205546 TaxID=3122397 RepID=UPI002FEEB27C
MNPGSSLAVPEEEEFFPASSAQQRLWFLQNRHPSTRAYVETEAVWLRGPLDVDALERALAAVVDRHGQLRAVFAHRDDELVQSLRPVTAVPVRLARRTVARGELKQWFDDETGRGFDLAEGPLWRATLVRLAEDEHVLAFVAHHIITDGWSAGLFFRDLSLAYRAGVGGQAPQWPDAPADYRDAVLAERARLASPAFATRLDAAAAELDGVRFDLDLPVEATNRREPAPAGTVRVALPELLVKRLEGHAATHGVTPFMLYAAAYTALLARYTGQDELVVAMPTAGRDDPAVQDTYGLFVNTVPLRVSVRPGDSWLDLIRRVRGGVLTAYGYGDVPLDRLAGRLGGMPLQTMLVVQPEDEPLPELPGIEAARVFAGHRHTKFELLLQIDTAYALMPGADRPQHGCFATLEFPADRFPEALSNRMLAHWLQLLSALVDDPAGRVATVDPVVSREGDPRAAARRLSNAPAGLDPVAAFAALATAEPDAPAVHVADRTIGYRALAARVATIQQALRDAGVGPQDFVGICLRRTPDLVAALLAVLRCGASYVPLDPGYPPERLAFIARDSQCALVLVEPDTRDALPADVGPTLDVTRLAPVAELPAAAAPAPEHIAYLIYTSGSTGRPKGVAVPYRALHAFLGWARGEFDRADLAVVLASTSVCFDLSVFEIFLPLSVGGSVRLVDTVLELAQQPGVPPTLVNTVPSAMAELLTAGALPSGTRVVNLAGEALPRTLVDRIHDGSPVVRVFNLYGPSEDTTYSTWCEVPRGSAEEPSIGRPIDGTNAYVLDRHLVPVPVGVAGELYLSGLGLAQGYLRRPELTAERFLPDPFSDVPGARMYRTGDRVRMGEDGSLHYLGRYDHQVKLRGFRIETGEIDSRARAVDGVEQALVVVRTVGDTPHLVCYWVGDATAEAIEAALRAELPGYMVPRYWVPLPAFPRNANGKIDRNALPDPSRHVGDVATLDTATEREVATLMARVTRSGPLGADADFFDLGGHSLLAMQLMVAVREHLGAEINLSDIFDDRTVRALAARIDRTLTQEVAIPALRRRSGTGPAPLAFAQERMWLVEQLRPGSAVANIGTAMRICGDLDHAALRRALQALTDRHEALRLRIDRQPDGQLRQQAVSNQPAVLPDLSSEGATSTERLLTNAVGIPFDLATEAPARWLLIQEPPAPDGSPVAVLGLVIHHVVADAWSLRLLFDELFTDYAAAVAGTPTAGAARLSVLDYAEWQRQHLDRLPVIRRDVTYWRERLADLPSRLPLAFDHPPETAVSFRAARLTRRLPEDTTDRLLSIGRAQGTTPFTTLLTVYQALLRRLSGQTDIVVGTPIANRDRPGTESLIGCLLNTLAIRADLGGAVTFHQLLAQTKERCLEAFHHQHAQIETVVAALDLEHSFHHTPVFQTMFVLHAAQQKPLTPDGLSCSVLEVPPVATQYDVTLMISQDEHGWLAEWDYRTDLFEPETIAGYADCLDNLMGEVARHPGRPIDHLRLCSADEQRALVALAQPETTEAPATLPALFAEQVAARPDAPAVQDDQGVLSYGELDARAERLARALVARNVRPDDLVAIVLPRDRTMVIALLAVAKAGAAFLCLDPALPAERMAWIADDAKVRLQVTDDTLAGRLDPNAVPALRVDTAEPDGGHTPASLPPAELGTEHLAYAIYTSGSTGTPKAVLLAHRGLTQLRELHQSRFAAGPGARVLQYAPYSFDASVWECVMGLLTGACLHLTAPDALLPGAPLAQTLAARGITHLTMPPSNLAMVDALPATLRHLVLAGEACPAELVQRWGDRVHIWNAYGPSEATVCATIVSCAGLSPDTDPTIGNAFPGAQAFVLDAGLNVLPPGVPGELYLGGLGLARGYLNRPELTAQTFVPHPYSTRPGERLYRTGDLARLTRTNEIEFLGRVDDQVKLRGIRIEPGEIERVLVGLDPRIVDAAVLVVGEGGDQHLVSFVAAPAEVDPELLRSALRTKLPGYMVPAWIGRLDNFPLTGNGKLDRRALAAKAAQRRRSNNRAAPPRGPVEQEVAAIWHELLPEADIGRDDSFFAIGGTSLTLTRLHERLDARYPGALKLIDLFRLNTVAAIADALDSAGATDQSVASDFSFRL